MTARRVNTVGGEGGGVTDLVEGDELFSRSGEIGKARRLTVPNNKEFVKSRDPKQSLCMFWVPEHLRPRAQVIHLGCSVLLQWTWALFQGVRWGVTLIESETLGPMEDFTMTLSLLATCQEAQT